MTYEDIDDVLNLWAERYGLHFYTKSLHDDAVEIHTTHIVDDAGDSYEVRIGVPDEAGQIKVSYNENSIGGKRVVKQEPLLGVQLALVTSLPGVLEDVYIEIDSWISGRGHTRTPVV